jgi:beta-galactosidase
MNITTELQTIQVHLARQTDTLPGRVVESLDQDWRFHQGDASGAAQPGFEDAGWMTLDVPHDYSIAGDVSETHPSSHSGGWVPTGVAWYRKHLPLPAAAQGRKVFVCFDGVSMNSQVWLNGRFLGQRPSGHTPFHYDLTPHLSHDDGAQNILAVRVDTTLQPYSRFYGGSGINRHVWLITTDRLHIEPWGVTARVTQLDAAEARLAITTDVRVERYVETDWDLFRNPAQNNAVTKRCLLTTRILDPQGRVCAEASDTCDMPHFSRQRVQQALTVQAPHPWSPEEPNLYLVQSQLSVGGQVIDETRTPLGIRTVAVDPARGFLLNGNPVKLKGVCLHQDAGVFGAAVPLKKWVRQLQRVKAMGANAVRTAHHPFPAEFYDCCDVLGLMVVDEAFDEWQQGWTRGQSEQPFGKNTYGYYQYFEQWHDADLRAMIRRDRHHPCVIMWSIGNEIPEQYYAEGTAVARRLAAICKEEDPTRPVTIGTEGNGKLPILDAFMEPLDVKGYNYIDLKHGTAFYDDVRRAHPDWVVLGTETGYDPAHWQAILRDPAVLGQFLWVGYDYLGEAPPPTAERSPNTLPHGWKGGLITITDEPKPEYHYRRCLWSAEPVVRLSVKTGPWTPQALWAPIPAAEHWNWPPGDVKTIYGFSNCEEVELFLNGRSLGVKRPGDSAHPCLVEWDVPFEPGILHTIGRRGGGGADCEHGLTTAGAPHHVELVTDDTRLRADGSDVALVDIRVVDARGIVVPHVMDRVAVRVAGAGDLAGLTNGDLDCRVSFRASETTLVAGRAQAVVRAAKTDGELIVTVVVDGLPAARQVFC